MGIFSDRRRAEIDGHVIDVEARTIAYVIQGQMFEWRLIIDNKKVDSLQGSFGSFTLRGQTEPDGISVTVEVTQSLLPTKYKLFISRKEISLQRLEKWYN